MATTYKWIFYAFDTVPSENNLNSVVKTIHCRLDANDGTHNCEVYSSISLDPPNSENYTEFDSLTEEQVISWVESKVDVQALKADLDKNLELLANPPLVTKSAPWAVLPSENLPTDVPSE